MAAARPALNTTRSLAPREHGAYGQLFAPMAAALLGTHMTFAGLAFAVAGTCAFYAHEPWLVIAGQRGQRAERELLKPARQRLLWLIGAAVVAGTVGLWLAAPLTRWAALGVGLLGLSAVVLSRFEVLHSALGEVWAGTVLSSLGIPIALAGGMPWRQSIAIALAWAATFAAGIFAVKGVIGFRKTRARGASVWGMTAVVVALALEGQWSLGPVIAVAPLTLTSIVLLAIAPSPKALRPIGWTLVGFTVLAAALMVVTARVT
jgi:hypothetical protein